MSEINEAIDRWADSTITDKVRKHPSRSNSPGSTSFQEAFYQRSLEGDVQCGALVTKIIERRCVMLGLHTTDGGATDYR